MPSFFILVLLIISIFSDAVKAATVSSVCDITKGADVVGLAVNKSSAEPLYCEYHYYELTGEVLQRSFVKYIDLKDQIFANKRLDYSLNPLAPNVLQKDERQGELRSLTFSAKENAFLLEYQKSLGEERKAAIISPKEDGLPRVADAGFDIFVKNNWKTLLTGKSVSFSFLAPIHIRKIALTVKQVGIDKCGGIAFDPEQALCLTIKPKGSLLKMFAKPLLLIYSRPDQQLMIFSGVANLRDDEGEPVITTIHYWHK